MMPTMKQPQMEPLTVPPVRMMTQVAMRVKSPQSVSASARTKAPTITKTMVAVQPEKQTLDGATPVI